MSAFSLLLFVGLFFRLLLVGNPGFEADISFWKSWSLSAIDHGVVWTAHNTNINYPPGFIYVLWLMGKIYSLFADPHNWDQFWQVNNFFYLLASKSIAVVSDIIVACLIYWFFSQKGKLKQLGATIFLRGGDTSPSNLRLNSADRPPLRVNEAGLPAEAKIRLMDVNHEKNLSGGGTRKLKLADFIQSNLPLVLSALFFLNPVVIIDSALWGQMESFGIMFTLFALVLIFYKRISLASALFTIGCLVKLQNIIYIPLFFLFIWRFYDVKALAKALVACGVTFFLVTMPFILQNDMNQVLYLLTVNSDYFPWLSLNAHNVWWIVSGAQGMKIGDRITAIGILNAKTVGLFLFSVSYLYAMIVLYIKPTARNLFYTLTLGIFSFFLLTTQSHERYSYPVVVFLLFLYPFLENTDLFRWMTRLGDPNKGAPRRNIGGALSGGEERQDPLIKINNRKIFWFLYLFLTIAIFFNIHTGLILNYPKNGFATITRLTTPVATIASSYLHIILFLLLFPFSFSQVSLIWLPLCLFIFGMLVFISHASYIFRGKVSLTSYKPVIQKQDFSIPQRNRTVNSHTTWKNWNRLSVDYMFYRKGFGSHANSTLVFDINRLYSRFSTDFGVDTEAATPATVTFKIFGDDKLLYESQKFGRFDFPGHTSVPVKGVKLLKLEITDAGDSINSDHADWLNPILYK